MTLFKKHSAFALAVLFCLLYLLPSAVITSAAAAYTLNDENTDSQGLKYTLFSSTKNALVCDTNTNAISGTVTIPESVTKSGVTYTVTGIENYTFYNCSGITAFAFSDNLKTIGNGAFRGCTSLTAVSLPESVTSIEAEAFYGCSLLSSVQLPSKLSAIPDAAFYDCGALTSITIPGTVKTIGNTAFEYCRNLPGISFPNGLESIGGSAFYGCSKISDVTIPDSVISLGRNAFVNTAWYKNQPDGLIYLNKIAFKYKGTLPENATVTLLNDTKSIGDEAFSRCKTLIAVNLPGNLIHIGSAAFLNCTSLNNVTIPASVTSIGKSAFFGCTNITDMIIPNKVGVIEDYTFYDCSGLRTVTIPANVYSISDFAFNNYDNLTFNVYINTRAYKYCMDHNIKYNSLGIYEVSWDISFADNYAYGIIESQTLSDLAGKLNNTVTVKDSNGNTVSGDTLIGTGSILTYNGKSYTIIVKGDINGDGLINAKDYLSVKRVFLGTLQLTGTQIKAACLGGTTSPTAIDYLKIKRHFIGIYNIYE